MKTIRVASEQDEIVLVAKRRKPRFARVWQVPSPSKAGAEDVSALASHVVATALQQRM
jgi:hypothetical protein